MPGRWIGVPLVLLLPLVWRAGLALVRLATGDARLARFLAPGVALSLWLLGVHAAGLLTHSFYVGLYVGTALPAALGVASFWLDRPIDRSAEAHTERTPWWMWPCAAGAVALMFGPTLWNKHDECMILGHLSIPAEMLDGVYPPRHLTFPAYELRYHYGIDLAGAVVCAVLGRPDVRMTVHLLSLALFGYAFCLYWLLGERLIGGRASGPVTAACVLFAGGAPYFCHQGLDLDYWTSMCRRGGTWLLPPMPSNFFQHPWSLGLPLFAMLLLVWLRLGPGAPDELAPDAWGSSRTGVRARWGWLLLGLVTVMLSLSQATLFVCVVPTLVFAGSVRGRGLSVPRLARFVAWAVAVGIAARLLHGFLAPVAEPSQSRFVFQPFLTSTSLGEWLRWHAEALGALLPLGVLGLFFLRSQRIVLGLLVVGGLLSRDLFAYGSSWDIVKFAMVAQIALGILAASAISAAFSRVRWAPLGLAGLAACTFFGFAWAVALARGPDRSCIPPMPSPADRDAMEFLRGRLVEGEGVYRSEHADAYAMYAGLPQPTWDWGVKSFGFGQALYDERQRLLDHPDDLEALRKQGFRWLVLAPRDGVASQAAQRWVSEDRAEVAAQFPPLIVYRLR
jgi:hypothetical protein